METNDQQNSTPKKEPNMGSLNTMQGDYLRAVRDTDTTLADVALEAQERKRRAQYGTDKGVVRVAQKSHTALYTILIAFFLVGAIGLIGYRVYLSSQEAPDPFANFAVPAPIVPNEQIGVSSQTFQSGFESVISNLSTQTEVNENEIVHIYFTDGEIRKLRSINEENPVEITNIATLFTLLSRDIPPSLGRSLEQNNYVFGIYGLPDNNRSQFLLLKTQTYPSTFAGMLAWEKTMAKDLQTILQLEIHEDATFKDVLFLNKDIRILETPRGKTVLLYSFIDTNTILITKSTDVYKDLLTRYYQSPIL